MTPVNLPELTQSYRQNFPNSEPWAVVRAPGRVNLIGEHTDYNHGYVLPIAITHSIYVVAGPRKGDRNEIVVHSTAYNETFAFSADHPGLPGETRWIKYVLGVAAILRRNGITLRGGNLLIHSDLPIGSGLSSSAALEIGAAVAMLALSKQTLDPIPLALIAQQAEHEYADSPCGIMDQFICVLAQTGHAILLDCRSQSYEQVPFSDPQALLMIMDTQTRHDIAGSAYPLRQEECRRGVELVRRFCPEAAALRDLTTMEFLDYGQHLDMVVFKRCRHVVSEIERTVAAARALRGKDFKIFGRLMLQSHESLRDDFEVSCPELDALVEIARVQPGVYGARMTGGGFGGCVIALIRPEAEQPLRLAIKEQYNTTFAKPAIVETTTAGPGVSLQLL